MRLTKEEGEHLETKLLGLGYRRYSQSYRSEDYMYWKGFDKDEEREKGYSIGFAFYDWSKYPQYTDIKNISVSLHFLLGNDQGLSRLDIDITDDDMTVEEMEEFGKKFYEFYLTTETSKKIKNET